MNDYSSDLEKGLKASPKGLRIGFGAKVKPEKEPGKFKITTSMSFSTQPKQPPAGQVKDKMEVVVKCSSDSN
jgi:hypothetical protein